MTLIDSLFKGTLVVFRNIDQIDHLLGIYNIFIVIFSSGNAFPNTDALMNAVLNFGQTREVLNTQYSNDQNPHVIPQNASRSQPPNTGGRTSSSQNPGKMKCP